MDRIVLVRLLAQDCRVHARSLAAASGPTIPRAELARSRAASGGFVSSRRPDGINTEVERSGTILSARLPRLSPRAVAQDTFAPGHHTNDVIMPDPFFNARRRLDPIAVYPAWRATQP